MPLWHPWHSVQGVPVFSLLHSTTLTLLNSLLDIPIVFILGAMLTFVKVSGVIKRESFGFILEISCACLIAVSSIDFCDQVADNSPFVIDGCSSSVQDRLLLFPIYCSQRHCADSARMDYSLWSIGASVSQHSLRLNSRRVRALLLHVSRFRNQHWQRLYQRSRPRPSRQQQNRATRHSNDRRHIPS